jgi:hypothetical protein
MDLGAMRVRRQRDDADDLREQPFGQDMKVGWQTNKWLNRKAKAGFRGFLMGTVASRERNAVSTTAR